MSSIFKKIFSKKFYHFLLTYGVIYDIISTEKERGIIMKVFVIKHITSKNTVGELLPKIFTVKSLANDYMYKLYKEICEHSIPTHSSVNNFEGAKIEYVVGYDEFRIEEMELEGYIDYLQEFCKEEVAFRLREYFGLKDEQIAEIADDVEDIIRDVIDNNVSLYDEMDHEIEYYLNKNNMI